MARLTAVLVLLLTAPSFSLAQDRTPPDPTPFEVAPQVVNRREIIDAIQEEYSEEMREAGVSGTTLFFMHVGETGDLLDYWVAESSGNEELDQAASRIAALYRFRPALIDEEPVAVWINVPIRIGL